MALWVRSLSLALYGSGLWPGRFISGGFCTVPLGAVSCCLGFAPWCCCFLGSSSSHPALLYISPWVYFCRWPSLPVPVHSCSCRIFSVRLGRVWLLAGCLAAWVLASVTHFLLVGLCGVRLLGPCVGWSRSFVLLPLPTGVFVLLVHGGPWWSFPFLSGGLAMGLVPSALRTPGAAFWAFRFSVGMLGSHGGRAFPVVSWVCFALKPSWIVLLVSCSPPGGSFVRLGSVSHLFLSLLVGFWCPSIFFVLACWAPSTLHSVLAASAGLSCGVWFRGFRLLRDSSISLLVVPVRGYYVSVSLHFAGSLWLGCPLFRRFRCLGVVPLSLLAVHWAVLEGLDRLAASVLGLLGVALATGGLATCLLCPPSVVGSGGFSGDPSCLGGPGSRPFLCFSVPGWFFLLVVASLMGGPLGLSALFAFPSGTLVSCGIP